MDIYIPKYKDIFITDGEMAIGGSFKGEYRITLRGSDGRIKSETDWLPNTLLNYGLNHLSNYSQTNSTFNVVFLGTGNAAVDITQTGLQGIVLGDVNNGRTVISNTVGIAPDYEQISTVKYTWDGGNGTGTINEFVITAWNTADVEYTNATVRVVLNAPITKGVSDELDIEWRQTFYPDTSDKTGQILISGVSYDYTIRHQNIDTNYNGTIQNLSTWNFDSTKDRLYLGNIGDVTEGVTQYSPIAGGSNSGRVNSNGGSLGSYYSETIAVWGIDSGNSSPGGVDLVSFTNARWIYLQAQFRQSAGEANPGGPLIKENTHELRLGWRTYPQRYVP